MRINEREAKKPSRKELQRELHELSELMTMPAIYTSRTLRAEIKAERAKILADLRSLPLAG